jgi:hypothetical protein
MVEILSMMASAAVRGGPNPVLSSEGFGEGCLVVHSGPLGVRDLVQWTKVGIRVAVTLETPAHAEGLDETNLLHFRDVTVAGLASNSLADVNAVIEISVVGRFVDANPVDRLTRIRTRQEWGDPRVVSSDEGVTVHTGLCGRQRCGGRDLDGGVAVTTIDPELPGVELVAVRHGLTRHVAYIGVLGRKVVPDTRHYQDDGGEGAADDIAGNFVDPLRKNLGHDAP